MPTTAASGRPAPDRSPRTAVVWDVIQGVLAAAATHALDVLDVGGGTGGLAVPLAAAGHRVTVVDPSPDALASLQRRVREEGVSVTALQGDAAGLLEIVPPQSADLVLCHGVLEHVDDVPAAVAALARVLRPGGALSVLAAHRTAAVVARVVAGRLAEARHVLEDPDGRWGAGDPLPRRFGEAQLRGVLAAAGLRVESVHGIRTAADLVPGAVVDQEPGAADDLLALERAAASLPELRAVATQLHLLARAG